MFFDQQGNLRDAIIKKKARIAEIERVLNRPPITEYRGQPVHGGQSSRLRMEEERQHLLEAVAELERELRRMLSVAAILKEPTKPFDEQLYTLKLQEPTRRLHEETQQCWLRVRGEVRQRGNRAGLYSALINSAFEVLRRHLDEVDRICREVWLSDHTAITPEFIRNVLRPRAFLTVAARAAAIEGEFKLSVLRTEVVDLTGARHCLVWARRRLEGEMANRYEAEAIEIRKKLAQNLPASAIPYEPMNVSPQAEADAWREFHERFGKLMEEEQREGAARRDRFLRAYYDYEEHPEVLKVQEDASWGLALSADSDSLPKTPKTKIETVVVGPFCLLETPAHGLWMTSDGVSEEFQERFHTLATRAGLALGCPSGDDPEDFWFHRLLHDLRENNSGLLFADNGEVGVIVRICEASVIFSSRLERAALGVPLPSGSQDGDIVATSAKRQQELTRDNMFAGPEFTHSADYRSVTTRGENYSLTSRQAQMIQILHGAHETGQPDVAIDRILEQLGTRNSRWQDTFKTQPKARKVLIRGGARKGTLRLNL